MSKDAILVKVLTYFQRKEKVYLLQAFSSFAPPPQLQNNEVKDLEKIHVCCTHSRWFQKESYTVR